jgi:arylesterase/paraoxonase
MMRRRSTIAAVSGALMIGIFGYGLYTLDALNAFRTIAPHFAGSCVEILGVTGGEDVAIDHQTNQAYVSATDRHARDTGVWGARTLDGIYRLRLGEQAENGAGAPQHLPAPGLDDFHPHGIDLHRLADGSLLLFAVNHDRSGHSVEILRVEDDRVVPLETVRHALIFTPNDVLALGPRSFYVTNDRSKPRVRGVRQLARDIFLPGSPTTVVLWDGENAIVAATDVRGANGIAMSADGREVYVSGSLGNDLVVFDRDEKDSLTLKERIPLGSSPDNVSVGPNGDLLVAGHPSLFRLLVARTRTPWGLIPSQVLAVSPSARGGDRVEEIYMNRGEEISNVTVAAPYGANAFVMGTAYDEGVLLCRRDEPAR